ncbi:MAG: alcohol dehydrogenase catalytic domain-containing protein [Lachnospiraceae bacterium]|nr:alcohol dehydrogenase catalytic domain-containing protein [Lachnospiraceae bacterium]
MINQIYQLSSPHTISIKYEDLSFRSRVIVKPEYMAVCHADQRYYQGQRDAKVLARKLPMALIHECCGRVVYAPEGTFSVGQRVVMIPNVPTQDDDRIYENYRKGSYFLSSGHDGFMRELVEIDAERVVACDAVEPQIAAITEFVSVSVHAARRFDRAAHEVRDRIGIWGDGSLAYVTANVLRAQFPEAKLIVVGRQPRKLAQFSFVHETYLSDNLPDTMEVDHAFECCGGEGSYYAIEDVIKHINPQGTLMLMGVSENNVPINTRMVREKGMTLVGCSRSGREDFEDAIRLLENRGIQRRLKPILYEDAPVQTIADIHRVFESDRSTPFKTVFKWEI